MYYINKNLIFYYILNIDYHHKLNLNYDIDKKINGRWKAYYGLEKSCK